MTAVGSDNAELAQELEALRQQQQAISGVLRAVARASGLQPVLEEVAEACRRLCQADHSALWLLEGETLVSVAHDGEAGAEYDREHPHALDRSTAAGRVALTKQVVHIPDVDADPEYPYSGPRYYRSMLGAPISFEEELIGVVVLVRREARPFTPEHSALLRRSPTRPRSRSQTRAWWKRSNASAPSCLASFPRRSPSSSRARKGSNS